MVRLNRIVVAHQSRTVASHCASGQKKSPGQCRSLQAYLWERSVPGDDRAAEVIVHADPRNVLAQMRFCCMVDKTSLYGRRTGTPSTRDRCGCRMAPRRRGAKEGD